MNQLLLEGLHDRLEVSYLDESGNVTARDVGESPLALKYAHQIGNCSFLCSFCYFESCEHLASQSSSSEASVSS